MKTWKDRWTTERPSRVQEPVQPHHSYTSFQHLQQVEILGIVHYGCWHNVNNKTCQHWYCPSDLYTTSVPINTFEYVCSFYSSFVLAASCPEAKIVTDANSGQWRLLSPSSCLFSSADLNHPNDHLKLKFINCLNAKSMFRLYCTLMMQLM